MPVTVTRIWLCPQAPGRLRSIDSSVDFRVINLLMWLSVYLPAKMFCRLEIQSNLDIIRLGPESRFLYPGLTVLWTQHTLFNYSSVFSNLLVAHYLFFSRQIFTYRHFRYSKMLFPAFLLLLAWCALATPLLSADITALTRDHGFNTVHTTGTSDIIVRKGPDCSTNDVRTAF